MVSSRAVIYAALAVCILLSGCFGFFGGSNPPGTLEQEWLSDTERDIKGNHHAVAAANIDGEPMVFAPISGHAPSEETAADGHQHSHAQGCALQGIDGASGEVRWSNPVPEKACDIHAIADPVVADTDGDGDLEVVAATTEEKVSVYEPTTGFIKSTSKLSSYGFTPPLVADFLGDQGASRPETAVVDVRGQVVVGSGKQAWRHHVGGDVQAQPQAVELDGDEQSEIVVGTTTGHVVAIEPGEGELWNSSLDGDSVTWMTIGQADDDPATEVAVGTFDGLVVLFDDDGRKLWQKDLGKRAAVDAFADGDGDGQDELYAVNETGVVTAFSTDGSVEWTRDVVEEDVQMTPPPVIGDVGGNDSLELVVADNTGSVTVLDPASGDVMATHQRDAPIWTHPTLADVDGDGTDEIFVMYGDGRVARLTYDLPE